MTSVTFTITENPPGTLVSTPESFTITAANTVIIFQLTGSAATDYEITGYSSNDGKSQLGPAKIIDGGTIMKIGDANSQSETINITMLSKHRTTGVVHKLDPIVVNDPP